MNLSSFGRRWIALADAAKASAAYGFALLSGTNTWTGVQTFSAIPVLSGGAISFPATQVPSAGANDLDDYEEGTFTPAFSASGATFSHSVQQGIYTKVGRLVTFQINILLNTSGNTLTANALTITGLPFAPGAGGMYIVRWSNSTTAFIGVLARAAVASTSLVIEAWTAATTSSSGTVGLANTVLHATNGSALNITGQYYV